MNIRVETATYRGALVVAVFVLAALRSYGSTIYVAPNGTGPVQRLTTAGTPLGSFGAANASAAAPDGTGTVYVVTPGDTSSTISIYNNLQQLLGSFVFNGGIDNGSGSPGYITDAAFAAPDGLWLSGFNGYIYLVSLAGTVLNSFDTGFSFTGVATDGTYLYTTSGAGFNAPSPEIQRRNQAGTVVGTINTGLNDTLGIGFDPSTSRFWVGGFDTVSEVAANGTVLNVYSVPGTQTGVEVGPSDTTIVPEPTTFTFAAAGLAAVLYAHRRRRRAAQ